MRFCILGENCFVFDRRTETPGISHRESLCEGCREKTRRELNLLRYDYIDLSQMIPKTQKRTDEYSARPKPASAPPIDIAVFTLRSQIVQVAQAAEVAVRISLNVPVMPTQGREGFELSDAVRYLHPHVDDLAALPPVVGAWGEDGTESALDGLGMLSLLGALHRRARRVCGLDPRIVHVPGGCPACGAYALRRHDDDVDRFWCARCHQGMNQAEYFAAQRMQFAPVTGPPPCR